MSDMVAEMVEAAFMVLLSVAGVAVVIAAALMGIDYVFGTGFADAFMTWVKGLLDGIGS